MRRFVKQTLAAGLVMAGGMAVALPAAGHVVIADSTAKAGSYFAAFFRVSHGCGESPVISITVHIPEGVVMAWPQPKAGWTYSIETATAPADMNGSHHHKPARVITAITWEGHLPIDAFDQFGVMLNLPAVTGNLYFPVVQKCASGEIHWSDIPAEGQAWHDVPHPAPVLKLIP